MEIKPQNTNHIHPLNKEAKAVGKELSAGSSCASYTNKSVEGTTLSEKIYHDGTSLVVNKDEVRKSLKELKEEIKKYCNNKDSVLYVEMFLKDIDKIMGKELT